MDIYQRQRQVIIKLSNYLKKVLPKDVEVDLDYLVWEFGSKEAIPAKFVTKSVEKILKFDFREEYKLIDGVIIKND